MTCAWVSSGERFHLHACLILGGEQAALNNRLCFLSSSSPHLPSDLAVLHFSVNNFWFFGDPPTPALDLL